MSGKRDYHLRLSPEERKLIKYESRRTTLTRRTRCVVLLEADESKRKDTSLEAIAKRSGASLATVSSVIKLYLDGGLTKALIIARNESSNNTRLKYDEEFEKKILSIVYSPAPEGRVRWTLTLIKETIELQENIITSISAIGRITKKYDARPHMKKYWCIPPEADADFVANMEDVISIYHREPDNKRPRVCIDEKPYQLLDEARLPIPMKPANPEIYDYEYKKNGTASIFCIVDVDNGFIRQRVCETRTAIDFAEILEWLITNFYKDAEMIILICDNLNTHTKGSLYKAYPPDIAFSLAQKLEFHYTPKHGSWLDMAEIGINVMTQQCLNRRIPSIDNLRRELDSWERVHNSSCKPMEWRFTIEKARVKLHRTYPDIELHHKQRDELRNKKRRYKGDSTQSEDVQQE